MNVPFEFLFVFGTAPQATTAVPVPLNLSQVVYRCSRVNLNHISFSKSEWPHSLSENCVLMRKRKKKRTPIPLIQPLSTDHVGEVPMDKPGCCSTARGQFHAHKRSQGSVKAHSSLNSRPSNPFMLLYQITSLALCMCCTHTHTHTQQSGGGMPDVSASSWSN